MDDKSKSVVISDLSAGHVIGKHARNVTQTAERVIRCASVIDLCFNERFESVNWPRVIPIRFINFIMFINTNDKKSCKKLL